MFFNRSPDLLNVAVTTWREHWTLKSEKLSPLLFLFCKQHQSLTFYMLRVDPENPFV